MLNVDKMSAMLSTALAKSAEEFGGIGDRAAYALKNTALGLLMVFTVLAVLYAVVRIVSVIMGEGTIKRDKSTYSKPEASKSATVMPQQTRMTYIEEETDENEIIAAISAAVAVVLESEGKDPRGFRVVSFKRSNER